MLVILGNFRDFLAKKWASAMFLIKKPFENNFNRSGVPELVDILWSTIFLEAKLAKICQKNVLKMCPLLTSVSEFTDIFRTNFFFGATQHTLAFQKIYILPILRPTDFMWNSPKDGQFWISALGCPLWDVRVRVTDIFRTNFFFGSTDLTLVLQNIYNIMWSW